MEMLFRFRLSMAIQDRLSLMPVKCTHDLYIQRERERPFRTIAVTLPKFLISHSYSAFSLGEHEGSNKLTFSYLPQIYVAAL